MNESVVQSLDDIESALRGLKRAKLLNSLQPGISTETVRVVLENARLSTNHELEALFGWHDGVDGGSLIGEISLFPGFYLLSLEGAIKNYQAFVADPRWQRGWLPIFADGGGDFYVMDLGSTAETTIRRFRIDEREHPVEFLSLAAMLFTLARAFDRGIFFLQGDYLEMDDLAFAALAAELNPEVEWWAS